MFTSNRVRRSFPDHSGLVRIAFEEAALGGIKELQRFWQHADANQRRIILETDNLAALLTSIIHLNTDHNLDMDVFKWLNQRIDNHRREVVYSKIFQDIIKLFISKNYVEGLHFIEQGMGDKWNNEFTRITLDTFLPIIMSLESPKPILSWFKLNVSNPEMVQSIGRIIDILNQMSMMKEKAEELKGKRSSDIERLKDAIARINSNPTEENITELLQTIRTVGVESEIESAIQPLEEYRSAIVDFAERLRVEGVNNYMHKIAEVEASIVDAFIAHNGFSNMYKNNLPKLADFLTQFIAVLGKEKDIRAKLDEVTSNTEGYSVARTIKTIEHCVQEMEGIERMFDYIKAKIRSDIEWPRRGSIGQILNKIFEKILQLGPSIDFVDELNQNFKLAKDERLKLDMDLANLGPKLAQSLERKSPSDLLQLRDFVSVEYKLAMQQFGLIELMLSNFKLVLLEKPIVDQQYRDFTAEIIKKLELELQLRTFDKVRLKFQDVLSFTSAEQIAQDRDDFIAKIRALRRCLENI